MRASIIQSRPAGSAALAVAASALAFCAAPHGRAAVLFDAPGHAAVEGARVAASGGEPGVAWTLLDWRGRETGVSGKFDEEGKVDLPPLPLGYYRMVEERDGKRSTSSLATLAVVPPPKAPPLVTRHSSLVTDEPAAAGSFFGADCAIDELFRQQDCPWNGGDAIRTVADLAQLAGFTHVRGRHNWGGMQPKPDAAPNCAKLAANAALFRERGIGVSGLFYGTPGWACDNSPRKLPTDLGVLYRSCRDIATAFGDTIADWEFFNETDIGFLQAPAWDYASAFKAASLGFKAGRPETPVLCAGFCTAPDGLYVKLFLENDAAPYFDAFNYHTYAAQSQYPAFVRTIRETLGRAGAEDKPIWITESGTNFEGPAKNDSVRKGFKAHSPEQELVVAEFAPKSQIALQMQGVERDFFFILAAYSERGGGKDWGLIRRDGTVKPAYAALATLAREVGDARLLGALETPPGLRAYLYEHADGSQTVAFWSVSPMDTATDGNNTVIRPEPELARTFPIAPLQEGGVAQGDGGSTAHTPVGPLRLVDLCGSVSTIVTEADGSLMLNATRYPAYLTGLRGLKAATGAKAPRSDIGDVAAKAATSPIIPRLILAPGDFDISNNKTLAVAKGDESHIRVQFWNFADTVATGTVEAAGALLDGLPSGPVTIAPFACAEFECVLRPITDSKQTEASSAATLVLRGQFNGREASRLSMPVFFEKEFLASCETVPLEWRDLAKWTRNDSADTYDIAWDEAEQAIRFEVEWKTPGVGRWFYPVLSLPPGTLDGAMRASFEVKSAQDKIENDFGSAHFMLVRGKKGGSPAEWLTYSPPIGTWERRYVELSACPNLGEVDAVRIGANPSGMRLTFWIRNLVLLKAAKPAKPATPIRVALTFDDSLKDHLLIAAPMLEERGWRGTFCIVTDWIGKDERRLTWDDVRELISRGHEIATHTKSHQNLMTLLNAGKEDEIRREIGESADKILKETGFAPRFMFSPFCCQNETTARICSELGLRQAAGTRYNFGSNNCDRVASFVTDLSKKGAKRADILTHGVSAADHGGWCPFVDRESFRKHLDAIAELERQGKIIVTDYDGMVSDCALKAKAWPRHGVLSLSFDDASFDQWEAAFPLFKKYDARTTFFVIGTNRVDFMKKALAAGHEIGLHGFRHMNATPTVEDRGEDWFWKTDIVPQIDALGKAGIPLRSYAYPNCRRTDRTDALFFTNGFARVRGTGKTFPPNPNPHDPKGEKLDKWRPVATTDWLFYPAADFLNARLVPNVIMGENYHTDIDDILRAMERAGERGEALFIVSHGIARDAKGISMKTEWLERMLSSANDLGLLVRGIR